MRIPNESLDDFMTRISTPKPAEPPPVSVVLHPTGKIEVLRPVALSEELAEHSDIFAAPLVHPATSGEAILASWGRRSLAVAGAFAVILGVLVAGIFIGISYQRAEFAGSANDVVVDQQPGGDLRSETPDLTGPTTLATSPLLSDEPRAVRSVRRPILASLRRAVYRPRRSARPQQIMLSGFVPTTLVIYAEKGEIKTRIEPQLVSGYKNKLTPPTN